jgi:hypothetical protein
LVSRKNDGCFKCSEFLWLQVFDRVKAKRAAEQAALSEEPIKVTLPDGKVMDGVRGKTSPYDIAMTISKGLAEAAVVAKVNDNLWDMKRPLEGRVLAKKFFVCSTRLACLLLDSLYHIIWTVSWLESLRHACMLSNPSIQHASTPPMFRTEFGDPGLLLPTRIQGGKCMPKTMYCTNVQYAEEILDQSHSQAARGVYM